MKKTHLLIVAFVLLFIGFVIFGLVSSGKNQDQQAARDTGDYYDPYSGETVSNPEGKSPEDFGKNSGLVLLGLGGLLDHGLTQDQLDAYRTALSQYNTKNKDYVKEASIDVSSIERFEEETKTTITHGLKFSLIINRGEKKFTARIEYTGLSSIKLILINPDTSKKVFESSGESSYYN